MADINALYVELKPNIEAVVTPLFDLSKKLLRERCDFLPHAAALSAAGKVELVGAQGEREIVNAGEILPILHSGLRALVKDKDILAIGVAESVYITLPEQPSTRAIKVLLEHRRGLTVAFYVPYATNDLKGIVFGQIFSMAANAEVKAW